MKQPIACIDYLNTEPYFHGWDERQFPLLRGAPRALAHAATEGRVMGGPLPIVSCWDLEPHFGPLGAFGIAAKEKVGSVFLVSRKSISVLDNTTIGVTEETSTSVVLCAALIGQKYGHRVRFVRGQRPTDAGFIVIGDAALRLAQDPNNGGWPYIADLASEWYAWQKLPFVFARWVARMDLAHDVRDHLHALIESQLSVSLSHLESLAARAQDHAGVDPMRAAAYLRGIRYRLDDEDEEAIRRFRLVAPSAQQMISESGRGRVLRREMPWVQLTPN